MFVSRDNKHVLGHGVTQLPKKTSRLSSLYARCALNTLLDNTARKSR